MNAPKPQSERLVLSLLTRLEGVKKSGSGWRARCPACGGKSQKLSITQTDIQVLLHCFGCDDANAVLAAVGLKWADLRPHRSWPNSPEESRRARRAIRESGWTAALAVLAFEAKVVLIAARQLASWKPLSDEDDARLTVAVERIEGAACVLLEPPMWRPAT